MKIFILKMYVDGAPISNSGSPSHSSVVFTLGHSFLLSRLNILGCKLISHFLSHVQWRWSRLWVVRGCFVSHARRSKEQLHSQPLLPFPGVLQEGPVFSLRKGPNLQLVPTGHRSLTVLAVKGMWWFRLSSPFKLPYSFSNLILLLPL